MASRKKNRYQASNEELRAANERLTTLNERLRNRNAELTRAAAEREAQLLAQRAKLRALAGKLIHEREESIRAVAREAHDTFAQDAVGTAMKLAELERSLTGAPAATRRLLAARVKEVRELAEGISGFARRIHPSYLDEFGLVPTMRMEVDRFAKHYGISIHMAEKGTSRSVPKDIAVAVYRVCQESLRNIVKHARAKHVRIMLTMGPGKLALVIRDDGQGFDTNKPKKKGGLGVLAMEERVRRAGGTFKLSSVPGKYTEIEVHIPLKQDSAARS